MQSLHGITASAFRMKFFKLFLLAALSATILTGCERQLVSPIAPTDPSRVDTQFAQKALSNLADTAAERGFVDLANAANEVAKVLTVEEDQGTTGIAFLKLLREAYTLQDAFALVSCGITLEGFEMASGLAAEAYVANPYLTETAVVPSDREQVLENLAQEALNAGTILRQFPEENAFIPFAFGYRPSDHLPSNISVEYETPCNNEIHISYDETIRPVNITGAAVVEFLTLKGYAEVPKELLLPYTNYENISINLNPDVNPYSIRKELIAIPGVARISICGIDYIPAPTIWKEPTFNGQQFFVIVDRIRVRYNEAWCQGDLDVIDSILIEESGLDFFNYVFVRNLAYIYAEEIPEAAERIQTNGFSLHRIAVTFLYIYFQNSEKSREEIIELFRQSISDGYVTIEHFRGGTCVNNVCIDQTTVVPIIQ
ncbi:hypothetical protein C6501_12450 [Candidatus Poribacteria bacterium]|nr:MAG: hypothetical protein C6501_12450 [Candidatus Poribacteria bacterium]